MQRDPVCQMDMDEQTAAGQSTYQGKTFYFCSSSCRDGFDKNLEQYLPKETDSLGRKTPLSG